MSPLYSTDNGSRVSTYRGLLPAKNAAPMPARTRPDGVPSIRFPSERHLLGRLRCGHCGSLVIVDDAPTADAPLVDIACWTCSRVAVELRHDAAPAPMTPARFAALPTQQGKRRATPGPKPKPIAERRSFTACQDCQKAIRSKHARCLDCVQRHRDETGMVARLVVVLGHGEPRHVTEIGRALGLTGGGVRKLIQRAIEKGRPIERPARGMYRLEVGS